VGKGPLLVGAPVVGCVPPTARVAVDVKAGIVEMIGVDPTAVPVRPWDVASMGIDGVCVASSAKGVRVMASAVPVPKLSTVPMPGV